MSRVLAVVLNYRTPQLTIDCLRSLEGEVAADTRLRVVVVDNASGDDSVDQITGAMLENRWSWARLMPLERNGGFAYGNNAAIREAVRSADPPDYVLLLNSDTLVQPGAVGTLVQFLDEHPQAGIAGSRLQALDGTAQHSALRFPTIATELAGGLRFGPVSRLLAPWHRQPPATERPSEADWVAGAACMVRRTVFETVGLLDEGYFLYREDVDFCLQARRAGWRCWYVPESRVVHLGGRSTGVFDPRQRQRRPAYWFQSRRRYFLKNHGWLYAAAADAVFATGFALWRIRRPIQRRPDRDPPRYLEDFLRHSVLVWGLCRLVLRQSGRTAGESWGPSARSEGHPERLARTRGTTR
jgi:N-acetylglucosaminyl-diphospho-decaprenol L-rhamnosyltransferase